ncbi:MAG: carboxypeptidase-like regulatory domain-containing protein [Candidatus Acidiferrales bacterium]
MTWKMIRALTVLALASFAALPLAAAPQPGKISGVVVDPHGTPQMGATVFVVSEQAASAAPLQLLTNDRGLFATDGLASGFYSIRATLAGFLPAIEQHIHVKDQQITQLQIELGSIFTSLDKFRRATDQEAPPDEWTWVLRTSASTRPILRWDEGEVLLGGQSVNAEIAQQKQARSLFELTSGGLHPGSISNLPDAPATAFAYDENLGARGHLVFAGEFGYDSASASGGFVAEWLPSGNPHTGPVSALVIRESELGTDSPAFRGARLSHDDQLQLGDRIHLRYGGEFLMAGYEGTTSSIRPRGELAYQVSPNWIASATISSHPWQDSDASSGALESALTNLDEFPTLLVRDNRSVLADDLHEEIAIEHTLNPKASVTAAVFHDHSNDTAVIGRGNETSSDFLQDFYSDAFAYDAGASSSWGARIAYEQKITDLINAAVVYAYAGAMVPNADDNSSESLRDVLRTQNRSSLAFRACAQLPHFGTQLTIGYKWIDGQVVSRQDAFGEAMYNIDPYLSVIIRQRLPKFVPGHATAMADFGNLLAQGYVPLQTQDGQVILVPSYRSFRGGVSFQF